MVGELICTWEFALHDTNDMILLGTQGKCSMLFIFVQVSQNTVVLEIIGLWNFICSHSEVLLSLVIILDYSFQFILLFLFHSSGFQCVICLGLKLHHSLFGIFSHPVLVCLFLGLMFIMKLDSHISSASSQWIYLCLLFVSIHIVNITWVYSNLVEVSFLLVSFYFFNSLFFFNLFLLLLLNCFCTLDFIYSDFVAVFLELSQIFLDYGIPFFFWNVQLCRWIFIHQISWFCHSWISSLDKAIWCILWFWGSLRPDLHCGMW